MNSLRKYFYESEQPRQCLSPTELQFLSDDIQQTLGNVRDRDAVNFMAAVVGVAAQNKPNENMVEQTNEPVAQPAVSQPAPEVDEKPVKQTGETSLLTEAIAATERAVRSETETKLAEANQRTAAEAADKQLWQRVAYALMAALALMGGWVAWSYRRTRVKLEAQQAEAQTTLDDLGHQLLDLNRRLRAATGEAPSPVLANRPRAATSPVAKTAPVATAVAPAGPPANTFRSADAPPSFAVPNNRVFYVSTPTPTPDGYGVFFDKRQPQPEPGKSFYRFELADDEGQQARFWLIDQPDVLVEALKHPTTYLHPACQFETLPTSATRVVNSPTGGWAVLSGPVWRVMEKAPISFV